MKEKDPLLPEDGTGEGNEQPDSSNNEQVPGQPPPNHTWYTQDEMLAKLGMHPNTLKKHRQKGHIGFSKVGAKFFYTEEGYQKFLMRFYKGPLLLLWALSWLADSFELAAVF
ncbi:helix-turn-helix domain-containing protein [Ginsengibacter hankyongi]|uniref:Helix-turn-helix domain-containing protein n=1 Tax=Ginsengibacter hankyongi TaxID=2607284 RepID=A0A5J5IQ35_9BACT|nr:helix-turn-helix domain-containing protein [Ginsengibacter hankyongi]KAA9042124.1 helix-turn-helix domain-containing protein [Ginsengibacter hankyongi]